MHDLLLNALNRYIPAINEMLIQYHFTSISSVADLLNAGYMEIRTVDYSVDPDYVVAWLKQEGFTISKVVYTSDKDVAQIFINGYIGKGT